MAIESDGHSGGNPRLYELIEGAPKGDGQEPHHLGLAPDHRLPEGRGPAGAGAVAAAPGAPAGPRGGKPPGGCGRPAGPAHPSCRQPQPGEPARSALGPRLTSIRFQERSWRVRMYPSRFRYEAPRSLDEAIGLLRTYGDEAKVLAGGQSLVPLMKLRFAAPETARRHQQHPRPGLPPGRSRRHAAHRRAVPARRPGALGPARPDPADHGRGRAADRRPDRPQPRHAGRLAVPRRPAGRLGLGACWRSAATSWRQSAARPAHHPGGRLRHRPVPERPGVRTRSRSRPWSPRAKGHAGRRLPQAGAPGRRLRHRRRRGRAWRPPATR